MMTPGLQENFIQSAVQTYQSCGSVYDAVTLAAVERNMRLSDQEHADLMLATYARIRG